MSTNLKSKEDVQQAFNSLFTHEDKKDEVKHRAHMLMFRFLSEVERAAEERKLKKKDIAKMIGTSPSYVTQLFRGDKLINMETLAKFEKELDIEFEITIRQKDQPRDKAKHKIKSAQRKNSKKQESIAVTSS